MAEVRKSESGGSALFATKEYAAGDVICPGEEPIAALAPVSDQDEEKLFAAVPPNKKSKGAAKRDESVSFTSSIDPPSNVAKDLSGKFCGMIQALASYTELGTNDADDNLSSLLELYHPSLASPSAEEGPIVSVANEVVKYVKNHSKGGSKLRSFVTDQPEAATKLVLVWSSNAFAGGRLYRTQCRINHSCDPNSVAQVDGNTQVIKAVAKIQIGEEITISYLGLVVYADRLTRQAQLLSYKHFRCGCTRCSSHSDPAAAVPCPTCHPRQSRTLDEEVAYDDEKQVHYAFPTDSEAFSCSKCQHTFTESPSQAFVVAKSVSEKVAAHLQDIEVSGDDSELVDEWEQQLHQLALSVVGSVHWTTNAISLLLLNRLLKQQHSAMIETSEPPELEEVAEAIDSLERLSRFADSLALKLGIGHLLFDVTVGVARSLVSLGDEKSKQYAAEWVGKVQAHASNFESAGMQKVVATLLDPSLHSSLDPSTQADYQPNKKPKM